MSSRDREHDLALDMSTGGPFVCLSRICERKRAVYGDANRIRSEQAPDSRELRAVRAHLSPRNRDASLRGLLGIGEGAPACPSPGRCCPRKSCHRHKSARTRNPLPNPGCSRILKCCDPGLVRLRKRERERMSHCVGWSCPVAAEHFSSERNWRCQPYAPPTPCPAMSRGLTTLSYSASSTPFLSAASLSVLPLSSAWWAILLALS